MPAPEAHFLSVGNLNRLFVRAHVHDLRVVLQLLSNHQHITFIVSATAHLDLPLESAHTMAEAFQLRCQCDTCQSLFVPEKGYSTRCCGIQIKIIRARPIKTPWKVLLCFFNLFLILAVLVVVWGLGSFSVLAAVNCVVSMSSLLRS